MSREPKPRREGEYHIFIGQLEGIVRPYEGQYYFSVRNVTRDGPTIYGFGLDFQKAVAAVEEFVDLLEAIAEHESEDSVSEAQERKTL